MERLKLRCRHVLHTPKFPSRFGVMEELVYRYLPFLRHTNCLSYSRCFATQNEGGSESKLGSTLSGMKGLYHVGFWDADILLPSTLPIAAGGPWHPNDTLALLELCHFLSDVRNNPHACGHLNMKSKNMGTERHVHRQKSNKIPVFGLP